MTSDKHQKWIFYDEVTHGYDNLPMIWQYDISLLHYELEVDPALCQTNNPAV